MPSQDRTRIVDSFSIATAPISFQALCERAVPRDARLLVLDLDRTVHFGRNMGELLGWEISAYKGYGRSYLEELEPHRVAGRLYLKWSRPLAALRYLTRAVRVWGPAGLFYLLWCKIAARLTVLRKRSYLRFGPEPVHAVQRVAQDTLFREMESLPPQVIRELATRVWSRYRHDLVVESDDLSWLRARCPEIRIVLSSASPREVVETAAAALGADDVIGSSPERINGGRAKLQELHARYPGLLGVPGVVTVGMSDTGYGEDHCWTEAFSHLVDVNSRSGFPPIVSATSPLRAICSAQLLTRAEKDALARGDRAWLDRRRGRRAARGIQVLGAWQLESLLAPLRAEVERLTAEVEAALMRGAQPLSEASFAMARALERSRQVLEGAVITRAAR